MLRPFLVIGSVVFVAMLLAAYAGAGSAAVRAAPPPQTTPTATPAQQGTTNTLDFRIIPPEGWEVEIISADEANFSREDAGSIYVTRLGDVPADSPLDAVLALGANEVRRGFLNYEEESRGTGVLNGRSYADSYFEGEIQGEEQNAIVEGRLLVVAGDDAVYMLMGVVAVDALDRWWEPVMESMESFQPVPGDAPAPATPSAGELQVTSALLASDVTGCEA
ncbi:MAG: hypothetical protein WD645_04415, partial [Dehalococcoidia bacterium]